MDKKITDRALKALPLPTKEEGQRTTVVARLHGRRDDDRRSLVLNDSYGGSRTWRIIYYVNGRPRGERLATFPETTIAQAKNMARNYDPPPSKDGLQPGRVKTFGEVAGNWLREDVDRRGLRSAREMRRHIERYVLQHWEQTAINALRRSDVNDLLRHIEREHGAQQADHVLSTLSSLFRWHAVQDDDFTQLLIVPGMQRDKRPAADQARDRTLSDAEIVALWEATVEPTSYNRLIRVLLLSAQRWGKVVTMRHDQIAADGTWTLPRESREKGTIGAVRLPSLALQMIAQAPPRADGVSVFGHGVHARRAVEKRRLDERMRELLPELRPWVHHDLRRTARSLTARAGVQRDIAEKVLGHTLGGVDGIYDRHDYFEPKADALEALARLIRTILA